MSQKDLKDILTHVKNLGFQPKTIFDVGVNTGTPGLYHIFDNTKIILIDPVEESEVFMQYITEKLPNASYYVAAAGAQDGETSVFVSPQFGGTSLIQEVGPARTVPMLTLDKISKEEKTSGPYLLKLDVQGGELEVLKGADLVLEETELLILEVSLFPFSNTPILDEVIHFMKERGFVAYDFFNFNYRPLDNALGQVDIVFVKETGLFKQNMKFRSQEEREKSVEQKLKGRAEAMKQVEAGTFKI